MSTNSKLTDRADDEIDLGQLFLTLWQGKWTITCVVLLALVLSVFWALSVPPTYRADALLQLEEKAGANPFTANLQGFGDDPASVTEIELLKSRMVLGQAVAEQNLDWVAHPKKVPVVGHFVSRFGNLVDLPEFLTPFAQSGEAIALTYLRVPPEFLGHELVVTKTSATGYEVVLPDDIVFSGVVGELLIDEDSGFSIEIAELKGAVGREFSVKQNSEQETIRTVRLKIGISEKGRNSGILNVTYSDPDKEDASRALDAIVNAYLRQNISRYSAEAENSLRFVEERIPEVRAIVDRAENQLKELQSERNTLDLSFETQALLEQRNQIEAELAVLEIEEQELQRKYTTNHPTYKILITKKEQLEGKLARLEAQSLDLPDTQREIFDVTQELELARETYSKLLIRAQELRVVKASTIGNVRVIDRAQTAENPVAPRKSMIVALGGMLGLMLGVAIVLTREFLSRGIKSSEQLEELGFSVFAAINAVKPVLLKASGKGKKTPILAVEHPTELAVEAFRGLRTSLHFGMLEADSKVLSITSASPDSGKSFCSTNLATVSAQAGQKVCLVDADMRRGKLRNFFGVDKKASGLADLLSGDKALDEVLVETSVDGLSFVPAGEFPPNPADLLMRPAFAELVAELSKRFDLVVFDCPPVLAVTDPIMIAKHASMTLVVVRYGVTMPKEVEAMQRELDASGVKVSGAIFNGFEREKSGKYGGYDYRYEYK